MGITDRIKSQAQVQLQTVQRHRAAGKEDSPAHRDYEAAAVGPKGDDPSRSPSKLSGRDFDQVVPKGLQIAAAWSWRVMLVVAVAIGLGYVAGTYSEVTIPVAVAILLAALLSPVASRLKKWGVPHGLAAFISVFGGLAVVFGALFGIGALIAGESSTLVTQTVQGFDQMLKWLDKSPLNLSQIDTSQWVDRLKDLLVNSKSAIATYAADIGSRVGHFVAGFAIAMFALFYFLYEGRRIFTFMLNFFPRSSRKRVDEAARLGWNSLVSYVRATIIVAFTDGVGVFIVAMILGVPLAPALAALVFIGAFIPLVGAFVSGFVAVVIALVALGWVQALIMLAGITLVMQVEGHILQPFLLGRAVKLHPLAVLLGIAVGIVTAGIVGALIVIPILAFSKTFIQHLSTTEKQINLRRNIIA